MPLQRTGPMAQWQSALQRARFMRRRFDTGESLSYFFPSFMMSIFFYFHYLECMASIYILFYCFLCLILYHSAGCGGSLDVCPCLSECLCDLAITANVQMVRTSLSKLIIIFYNTCCIISHSLGDFAIFLRNYKHTYQINKKEKWRKKCHECDTVEPLLYDHPQNHIGVVV